MSEMPSKAEIERAVALLDCLSRSFDRLSQEMEAASSAFKELSLILECIVPEEEERAQ